MSFGILDCKTALIALLTVRLPISYGQPVDVQEMSGKDFDEAGSLVLKKVAVRVRFGTAEYGDGRDTTNTVQPARMIFQVVCRSESLRSKNESLNRSLELAAVACNELAAARLVLPDGSITPPAALRGVLQAEDQYGPVEDAYVVAIELVGTAQFPGTNFVPAPTQGAQP